MDSAPFDRLARTLAARATRRASLSLLAAVGLFALGANDGDAAKNRRKKRRNKRKRRRERQPEQAPGNEQCLALHDACLPGQAGTCCDGRQCDQTVAGGVAGTYCCDPEGATCASGEGCCSGSCDFLVAGGTCSPCRGRSCNAGRPCCGGLACANGYCGGCRDRAVACTSNTQCCFSDCTGGACLSQSGGPCARDVDCKSCYLGGNCTDACVNGACAV